MKKDAAAKTPEKSSDEVTPSKEKVRWSTVVQPRSRAFDSSLIMHHLMLSLQSSKKSSKKDKKKKKEKS